MPLDQQCFAKWQASGDSNPDCSLRRREPYAIGRPARKQNGGEGVDRTRASFQMARAFQARTLPLCHFSVAERRRIERPRFRAPRLSRPVADRSAVLSENGGREANRTPIFSDALAFKASSRPIGGAFRNGARGVNRTRAFAALQAAAFPSWLLVQKNKMVPGDRVERSFPAFQTGTLPDKLVQGKW